MKIIVINGSPRRRTAVRRYQQAADLSGASGKEPCDIPVRNSAVRAAEGYAVSGCDRPLAGIRVHKMMKST